jgi:aryl-phospho-beta-D-glucosidase BglC (GH1 family)
VRDFDYFHPDESVWEQIDAYLEACQKRGLHMCLNLHRAPGYCINANHLERHNLWLDPLAQDAFVFTWEQFARRYQGLSNAAISFDLVNEPPNIGQYGLTRENHAALVRRTVAAIRAIDAQREITIDGLEGGNTAMPELADAGVIHSGRGYQPQNVSHYEAQWWPDWQGQPFPVYPGTQFMGRTWDRAALHDFYQPWRDVQAQGVTVHIGEFGCFNHTPQDVALRWFGDLLSVFRQSGWGYSLWEFEGAFGIIDHGRPGARYELLHGYRVDRALMDLLLANRVKG